MVDMKFRDEQLAPQPLYRKLTKADREKIYGQQSSSEDEDSKCDLDLAHLDEGDQEDLDPYRTGNLWHSGDGSYRGILDRLAGVEEESEEDDENEIDQALWSKIS